MKKVTAYVKPFKLESVLQRLPQDGLAEALLAEVRGYGRQKSHLEQYQGGEYELAFLPKVRLEVYCEDQAVDGIARAITEGARTGRIGDGKLWVGNVEQEASF